MQNTYTHTFTHNDGTVAKEYGSQLRDPQWPKLEEFEQQKYMTVLDDKCKYPWFHTDINTWLNKQTGYIRQISSEEECQII